MDALQPDLFLPAAVPVAPVPGETRKRAGIERTRSRNAEWTETAVNWFQRWPKPERFRMEEFRMWAEAQVPPISQPSSHHAWGALAQQLVKSELIAPTGQYEPAQSPRTHGHPVMVYKASDSQ